MTASGGSPDWQRVIWREWHNCEDEQLKDHLFQLVDDECAGRVNTVSCVILSMVNGIAAALLSGMVFINRATWYELGYWQVPKGILALLDEHLDKEPFLEDGTLFVNWLSLRKLFDFDRVEVLDASDEDVERFCVQVGNDTDPGRREKYRKMHVLVNRNCGLSDNTMRIMKNLFGTVMLKSGQEA